MRLFRSMLAGSLAALLVAACGGGGGEREFGEGPAPGSPSAVASVELTRSSPTISSDGRQTVRMIATAKNAGNVTLPGVAVDFSVNDPGASLTVVNEVTDATGRAEAVLQVQDATNRTVIVTADAADRRTSLPVDVVGTVVSVSGPESAVAGRPTVYRVLVRDASGEPVVGQPVQAAVSGDVSLSQSATITGALGSVDVIITSPATTSGTQVLTVSAAGANTQREVRFSSNAIEFQEPMAATEITVNSPARPIVAVVREAGVPVAGRVVNFTTTRGTLEVQSVVTDANGVAYTSIASSLAGRSLVTASLLDGTVSTRDLLFVGGAAAKIELQASPSTVGVNIGGSGPLESSEIIAIVRDAVDNPVKGQRVNFSVVDPSAGAGLAQSFAITDESGRASVTFYPGPVATGANQIVVTARVDCSQPGRCETSQATQFTDQTLLTAARRALQIRIGTGNSATIVQDEPAPVYNELPYGVLISDSAGNPVSGVSVNASLVGIEYGKGLWRRIPCGSGEPCWEQANPTGTSNVDWCPSEDVNENLRLDPGEDRNGDGLLTPGNPTVVYFGETGESTVGRTDGAGSSIMRIRYLRDRNAWLKVRLRVTATVPDGTEGFEEVSFVVPVLGPDLTSEAVPPPGQPSPYGVGRCP